ncbi:MAG: magnesium transporter [Actinobacteria bacterium]|nr:magnesium transporter [Actinomycetota bacterium]
MDPKDNSKISQQIQTLIKKGSRASFISLLQAHHEADIADSVSELSLDEQKAFFLKLNPELGAHILEEYSLNQQIELISELKTTLAAKYIEEMEPDDAVDLIEELQETNQEKADHILKALPQKEADELKTLLAYPENSAGAIMTSHFISIPENLSVKSAINRIRKANPPDSEISFFIYVVNKKTQLKGVTSLRNIVMANATDTIQNIRNNTPIKTHVETDQEDVAKLFQKYDLISLPVVNDNEELVGIITVDDIVDVVVEEASEDLLKLSGTAETNENTFLSGNLFHNVLSRLPWLSLTISGGIIASYLITYFSKLYQSPHIPLALCLSFIPMLMGLGGNVGNQSATIIVRGLSLGLIKQKRPLYHVLRETFTGLLMGSIIGTIVAGFTYIYISQNITFCLIIGLSLIGNMTTATIIGAGLPILLSQLKIDPAVASAPVISSTLDILTQLIYFALTLLIFQQLL